MPVEMSINKAMADLSEYKRQAAELLDQADAIKAQAEAEHRSMTEEERKEYSETIERAFTLEEEYQREFAADQRAADEALAKTARQEILGSTAHQRLTQGPYSRVTRVHKRVLDDPARGFANLGEFALTVQQTYSPGNHHADERLVQIVAQTGMNQAQGSEGGYAVPPQFNTSIWDGLNAMPDNLMQYCDVYTVTGDSLTFSANAETSRATGSRYGGVRAYWIAEGQQITSSFPRLRQMKLEPQEIAALVPITNKLLGNAPALGQYLSRAAMEEIAFLVNDAIINGDGVGKPQGVMQSGALITAAAEGGQAVDTVVDENIEKMHARLHARARNGAAWYINQDVEPQMNGLLVGTWPVMLNPVGGFPSMATAPVRTLKGLPIRTIEFADTIGNLGDIMLLNLGYYALGVRAGGMDQAMSIHLRFDYAESVFRFMFAVDGQSWLAQPLTPFKGTNTLSPFVTLAAR